MHRTASAPTALIALALVTTCAAPALAAAPDAPAAAPHASEVRHRYTVYGVALTDEALLQPGPICPSGTDVPCIFGSGGGLTLRAGYRSDRPFYIGGAYEFAKLDANNLYRLGILQEVRGEVRMRWDTGRQAWPFALGALGAAVYGNEWGVDTVAASGRLGFGLEIELSTSVSLQTSVAWHPLLVRGWLDAAGQSRDTGVAQFFGLERGLEQRDTLDW